MPRPGFPPTPVSSTDISAKDHARGPPLDISFNLPPPALTSTRSNSSSNTTDKSGSSYHPASPAKSLVKTTSHKARRTSSSQNKGPPPPSNADFSLPPPPTRSRKIILMKPGAINTLRGTSPTDTKGTEKKGADGGALTSTNKKQPTSTSAAGKKIARKTAHSLIERRRRSKMNEEFGVLKDMIPACHGQDMHKLAILQASIDYVRYLKQCVTDLKAANHAVPSAADYRSQEPTLRASNSNSPINNDDSEDDMDEDLEMQDQTFMGTSPMVSAMPSRECLAPSDGSRSTSPIPMPSRSATYNSSYTSTSSLPSPAFSARSYQQNYRDTCHSSYGHSTETSPAILPIAMQEADHEATAALLMLNADRRHSKGVGRCMSVQDLLSA
ncbi:hypothetical protein MMC13_004311 [Lambiella insularis]|nr:hypothetical protein [Lambiella insularis]